jgi:hypothetical protein
MATFKLEEIIPIFNAHARQAVETMLAGDAAKAFGALDAGAAASSSSPTPRPAKPSSRRTLPACPARTAQRRSSATRPAKVGGISSTSSAPRSRAAARLARTPWSRPYSDRTASHGPRPGSPPRRPAHPPGMGSHNLFRAGATCDRVMAHLEALRASTADAAPSMSRSAGPERAQPSIPTTASSHRSAGYPRTRTDRRDRRP